VSITYEQVRKGYSPAKSDQERLDVMFRWFARPISFPVAWAFLRLGLTPNAVTMMSLFGNVVGLGLICSGQRVLMIGGVAALLVALVLDAADGNMARAAQIFSPLGEWLEGVGAYVLYGCFHLVGGIGAYRSLGTADPVFAVGSIPPSALIALGAIASISITLTVMVAAKVSVVFPGVERESVVAKRGGGVYGLLFTVGRNLSFPSGLVLPASLLALVARHYELLLGFFAIANVGMFIAVIARCAALGLRHIRGTNM